MFGRKRILQKKHDVIVDMIDFLITYASQKLGFRNDLAQLIVRAGSSNLTGLDSLFHDKGFGRINKFLAIGAGAVSNSLPPEKRQPNVIADQAQNLGKQAMRYLSRHQNAFNHWLLD